MFLTLGSLKLAQVHTCTTAKQIELESHGWSGLVGFEFASKPDQPGLSSLICLEVIKDKRKILVRHIQTFPFVY